MEKIYNEVTESICRFVCFFLHSKVVSVSKINQFVYKAREVNPFVAGKNENPSKMTRNY